jgi:predicted lipid-binding transport protein (Tim44 family)
MNNPIIQLLVLAGIAIFLILRLRNVLGTRDGHEEPRQPTASVTSRNRPELEVIEGGPDRDILDHVPAGSEAFEALSKMKRAEPSFGVSDFLSGARGAYEMILMGFERGDLDEIRVFLSDEIAENFDDVIAARAQQGLTVEAEFVGVRELTLSSATFEDSTSLAEVTVRYTGELTYVVRNSNGEIIEGSETQIKRQKDVWTYSRQMGADDPNWHLVAIGE